MGGGHNSEAVKSVEVEYEQLSVSVHTPASHNGPQDQQLQLKISEFENYLLLIPQASRFLLNSYLFFKPKNVENIFSSVGMPETPNACVRSKPIGSELS